MVMTVMVMVVMTVRMVMVMEIVTVILSSPEGSCDDDVRGGGDSSGSGGDGEVW